MKSMFLFTRKKFCLKSSLALAWQQQQNQRKMAQREWIEGKKLLVELINQDSFSFFFCWRNVTFHNHHHSFQFSLFILLVHLRALWPFSTSWIWMTRSFQMSQLQDYSDSMKLHLMIWVVGKEQDPKFTRCLMSLPAQLVLR